jgi:hypothetical protein
MMATEFGTANESLFISIRSRLQKIKTPQFETAAFFYS